MGVYVSIRLKRESGSQRDVIDVEYRLSIEGSGTYLES